jgi:hypothetical protein
MDATITLKLPSALRQAIDAEARREGTTLESLAAQALRERFTPGADQASLEEGGGTLADLLAEHIGVLDSGELIPGGARLSERRAEYADMLMRDHRERRP